MIEVLGVGIVGAGGIFPEHAAAYEHLGKHAKVVGLAELDENRLRTATERFFIPIACSDYKQLLQRDDIDIIDVCTPPSVHEEVVIAALEAGKYVICEKPLAHTLASADRVIETARRRPGGLSVVYPDRYLPEVRRMIWTRDNDRLGALLFGRFSRYASLDGASQRQKGWWGRWDIAGGGVVISQSIHELDLMVHIFGPAIEVSAVMGNVKEAIESEDTFTASVRFANGAMACCFGTLAAQGHPRCSYDVLGEKASAHSPWRFDSMDDRLRRNTEDELRRLFPPAGLKNTRFRRLVRKVKRRLGVYRPPQRPSLHTLCLEAAIEAVRSGQPPPIGPEEARLSLELVWAIYTSALTGKPVSLPLDNTCPYYEGVTPNDYDGRKQRLVATER